MLTVPRKPASLELVGGKGPRQRLWDRIRALKGADFELAEITLGAECKATVRDYVVGLERAGYLALTQASDPRTPKRWRLVRDAGAEAPRVRKDGTPVTMGLAQEQMWRTLRMMKGDLNARELAAHAGTPEIPVREAAAADYLGNLHRAGYLECVKPGKGTGRGGIQARYRLVKNTGPRPPMVCRTHAIYDPNLGRIVWYDATVTEEDAIYGN